MNDVVWKIIDYTLSLEGGYVNDPHDPGGETKYGISKRSYPDVDIANLTKNDAVYIYYYNYWISPGYNDINTILAAQAFDHGVNRGTRNGVKLLQRAIGCSVDGIIGPNTIAHARSKEDEVMNTLAIIYRLRLSDYDGLRPDLVERYGRGWHNRASKFHEFTLKLL